MAPKLQVIITATRPGRVGPAFGRWFAHYAKEHGAFDTTLVDLADFNLPVFDEPNHPRMAKYEHEATQKWSDTVKQADAYVFVLPEYNYFPPASFINAFTFLSNEWAYKVAGFVSYAHVSGGTRAVQVAKGLCNGLKMVTPPEGVAIPNFPSHLDANKEFAANDLHKGSAKAMLDEMLKWEGALKPLRG